MANSVTITPPPEQKDLTRRAVLAGLTLSTVPRTHSMPNVTEGAPVPELRPNTHPLLALPFVRDTTIYERTSGANPRIFWSVAPTGSYSTDCATGAQFAAVALDYMASARFPQILQWAVFDMMAMGRAHSGIEVGFLTVFGRLATQAHAQPNLLEEVPA